jgi:ketosteroid isomerase-like protein
MENQENIKQIRQTIENWAKAVRQENIKGILANHSDDIVMFDVPEPLQSKGIAEYKKTWDVLRIFSKIGRV